MLEESTKKQLEKMSKGSQLDVQEGDEIVTYIKLKDPVICKEHYFEPDGEGFALCKCGNGRVLGNEYKIKDGKIIKKGV